MIIILSAGGGYYYYYLKSLESLNNYRTLISPTPESSLQASPTPTPTAQESCAQFDSRFGTTATELVSFINNEPDSATVMRGFRYVFGQVVALPGRNNLPFFVTFDSTGKITSFECAESLTARDYSQDIDFTIPEIDFAQIVRYRESLEVSYAQTYLQNVTTNPSEAKQIILQRIQALNQ